jgi:hypothetical protein
MSWAFFAAIRSAPSFVDPHNANSGLLRIRLQRAREMNEVPRLFEFDGTGMEVAWRGG